MNGVTFFFAITTVCLAVLLWSCYKNGEPARKAKKAAEEVALKEAAEVAKRQADAQFTTAVVRVLEDIVAGRIEAERSDYGSSGRERYKFASVKLLQDMKGSRETVERILGRVDRTNTRMDELSNQICEVHSVLRVYHPRHGKLETLPTIRKG